MSSSFPIRRNTLRYCALRLLHPLKGKRKGQWAIKVTGNWRIVFELKAEAFHILDFEDYHRAEVTRYGQDEKDDEEPRSFGRGCSCRRTLRTSSTLQSPWQANSRRSPRAGTVLTS